MVRPASRSNSRPSPAQRPDGHLPDSSEQWGECPRCSRLSNFKLMGTAPVTYDYEQFTPMGRDGGGGPAEVELLRILQCQGCDQNVVVIEEEYLDDVPKRLGARSGRCTWRGTFWWPSPGMQPRDPDVPSPIAEAIAEGVRCSAAKAPRAAAVMFRSALALIVDDRGSAAAKAKPNLYQQLKQMGADKDLDGSLAELADHVRVIGNAGAHPSTLDPVSIDEANELAEFIGHLTTFLYVMPARVNRSKANRP